jgi:hypothetical protein
MVRVWSNCRQTWFLKKPVGEWNAEEIIAAGNHIKATLNGEVI